MTRSWTQAGGEHQVAFMAAASRAARGEPGPCPRCGDVLRCYVRVTRPERRQGILWLWCGGCWTFTVLPRIDVPAASVDPFAALSPREFVELERSTAEPFLDRLERLWSEGKLAPAENRPALAPIVGAQIDSDAGTRGHAAVVEQIRAAFPSQPLVAEGAFAPWGNGYPDAGRYAQRLEGATWDQLDRELLVRRSDALGFLGTSRLAAVLPAYLTAMVQDGVWSPASGMLTIILTRPAPGTDAGLGATRFDALLEALTPAQRHAVAAALGVLADVDDGGDLGAAATAALASCWNDLAE